MNKQIFSYIKVSALALALSFGTTYVYAWTAPTLPAPSGNVNAPINTGTAPQTKTGPFTATSLTTGGAVTATGAVTGGSINTAGTVTATGAITGSKITAPSHCIGLTCIIAWPAAYTVGAGLGLTGSALGLNVANLSAGCTTAIGAGKIYWDTAVMALRCGTDQTGGAGGITGITGGGGVTASAVSGVVTLGTDATVLLNTSATYQAKVGNLGADVMYARYFDDLDNYLFYVDPASISNMNAINATARITAPTYCIGADCRNAWPAGGSLTTVINLFTASPNPSHSGGTVTLKWSSSNTTSCTISWNDGWSSGSVTMPNPSTTGTATHVVAVSATTYTLNCTGGTGSPSQTVRVYINDGVPATRTAYGDKTNYLTKWSNDLATVTDSNIKTNSPSNGDVSIIGSGAFGAMGFRMSGANTVNSPLPVAGSIITALDSSGNMKWSPAAGGGNDNLGNHTATQDLNMAGLSIYNLMGVNNAGQAIIFGPKTGYVNKIYSDGVASTANMAVQVGGALYVQNQSGSALKPIVASEYGYPDGSKAGQAAANVAVSVNDGGAGLVETHCPAGYAMTGIKVVANVMTLWCNRL